MLSGESWSRGPRVGFRGMVRGITCGQRRPLLTFKTMQMAQKFVSGGADRPVSEPTS